MGGWGGVSSNSCVYFFRGFPPGVQSMHQQILIKSLHKSPAEFDPVIGHMLRGNLKESTPTSIHHFTRVAVISDLLKIISRHE